MTKKLKSLNPIIGTGYKTLSTIKDGEDGNIENFPDTLPKIPRLSYKRLGVSGLEIGWEFEDKIYYTYELYGSTTKGFEASEENLIFQGLASSYFYEAKPGEKWYFKARAKNTHGRYTEFSSELVTYTIKLDNLGDYVEGESINGALIENATINNAHIKDLHADKITAGVLDADRIGANSITANKIEANAITSEKIQANAITTDKLAANTIASNHIQSGTITSGHIQSGTIESGHIKAGTIESNHIKSNSINSNHIQANTIQSGHIQTGAITAGSGIIAEGAIGSAQISSLDAAKIEAGTIDTSKVTVQGTNGHLRIKGNRLQVFNGTESKAKERVSVGDVNGDGTVYGLRVRGADGTTVLLDENGVTKEGITDGSITNDKISDNAEIDGAKLNINSVVSKINEDGTEVIKGTKIEVDGTTLTTKLSNITTKQTENSNKITQAQTQIKANENAIKLKVDTQTYQTDKNNTQTSLNKHTSEISALQDEIALKVDKTGVEEIIDEVSGELIDSKIDTAKAEIKVTTDKISQNVTNLTNTVSKKADGSTVTTLSNKVGTLETSVNGISGKVTNLETTTTTLNSNVTKAQNTANTANSTANSNKTNITNLQGEVNTVKSDVASLEVTTSGISQKVSNVESTTATLTTKVNTAQSTADSAKTTANTANTQATTNKNNISSLTTSVNNTNTKVSSLETNLNSITSRVSATETNLSTTTNKIDNLQVGGRNLIKQSVVKGNNVASSSYDKNTATWTLTANSGVGGTWGAGLVISGNSVQIPYGKTYVLSFEIKVPRACSWNIDVNNYAVSGSSWSGNDNDNGSVRATSSKNLVANQWIKCWSRISNTDSRNTDKVDIYDNSNFGVVMQNESSSMTFQIRNVQGEIGNIPSEYTPAPEDVQSQIDTANTNVSNLTTRVSNAESKLTKDSLTTTIGSHYTTSNDVNGIVTSKGYQTQSQVQQTVNGLEVKVKQSGGYNNLFNSGFKKGTSYWSEQLYGTATNKSISTWDDSNQYILPNTKALVIRATNPTDRYGVHQNVKVKEGATYSISALSAGHRNTKQLITIRKASDGSHIANIEANPIGAGKNINNWRKMEGTFTIPSGCTEITVCLYMVGTGNNSDAYVWYTNVLLSEGKLVNEWSPHPSEIYDGVTTIDKDGVTVTASNVKSKTNMCANGFKITKTDTNEDVFKVNSDGTLYMKGQITVTGGSVPTSNLSGTISSNQLNSSITSDINNAKNNASSALSTANTASTNATNALNTANSVNNTVNSNKNNWNNAYNRVNEWAYGAVTGSTTIDGGYIQADTITAKHMAIGDFNNYSQLVKGKSLTNRYGTATWTEGTSNHSYWVTTNQYFPFTVNETLNPFKAGDQVQIKFDAYTPSTRNVQVGIWFYSGTDANGHIGDTTASVSCSASWGTKTVNLTLPSGNTYVQTAKSIAILINNGTSGERIEVRNVTIRRLVAGDLIVDGAITANKITSRTITADKIATGAITANEIKTGSITATQIAARTITASEIASNAITADKIASNSITSAKIASGAITANMITSGTMSANRITGGTLKSTNGNMYFDMDNGYMILYNNGTKVGQTLMNKISGTSVYGISNGCEYESYSTMSAKTSSSASTYTMMLSVAGKDLSNNVKYGVNLGTILSSHGNNFNLHNTYLCFGLGASSYSTVGQIRWYSDSSNWSWIGITNSTNIGLFGQSGFRLGTRVSSSNTSYIGVDATADSYSCKAHIWQNLNMHNWKIRYCQGVSTASLEINEEIPFAYSANSDGEEGEILTNSYNVVKTKQNIVETMGSVTITEDMVDKEVYIELDAYMAYKNYMVILSPVGEDRKVCVLRKEDDGFYIKGNKGDVDYIIKYECIDVARYRNSTGEDAPENIVEEKENEPKPIILEEQI